MIETCLSNYCICSQSPALFFLGAFAGCLGAITAMVIVVWWLMKPLIKRDGES